jgi:sodium-dependent dicarboxylate transporter 2/3/5
VTARADAERPAPPRASAGAWIGYAAGPCAAIAIWAAAPATMPVAAARVAGLAAWMAVWWLTAVIPLAATALLPLAVLPLAGAGAFDAVARRYADPIVFLFLGGFFLAAASERWGLHRRLAFGVLALVGADASRVVLAVMAATAFLSMWISNTATAALMLPLIVAIVDLARREAPDQAAAFGPALVLGMAYSASIGGVATLIGTPPTAIFAGAARASLGRPIGFAEWLSIGLPIALLLLLGCWLLLVRGTFRVRGPLGGLAGMIAEERARLGGWAFGERATLAVLVVTALAWILQEPKTLGDLRVPGLRDALPGLSDAGIAVLAALVLFVLPASRTARRFALDWETAARIPWDVLLLFGGGLALAGAFDDSGLTRWLAERLGALGGLPPVVAIAAVTLFFVLLTELTSNTATAAMAMPIVAAIAPAVGGHPVPLMAAAALGSAMGFMLPVGTPPNALAFGTGAVSAADMRRAGLWLDLLGVVVITTMVTLWGRGFGLP